jgi:hypothetical protein
VRHWEDNYVFMDALRYEVQQYNSSEPLLLARWPHVSPGNFAFPDGGSAWVLSKAGMDLWGPFIARCIEAEVDAEFARRLLGPSDHIWANCKDAQEPGLWCAEDVFLGFCLQQHGVRMVPYQGTTGGLEHISKAELERAFNRTYSLPHAVVLHPATPSQQQDFWARERLNNREYRVC